MADSMGDHGNLTMLEQIQLLNGFFDFHPQVIFHLYLFAPAAHGNHCIIAFEMRAERMNEGTGFLPDQV